MSANVPELHDDHPFLDADPTALIEPPPRHRHHPVAAILGAVALVLASIGGVVVWRRSTSAAEPAGVEPAAVASATSAPSKAKPFGAVVEEIEAFVAAERGLPFLEPVDVELLSGRKFVNRLIGTMDRDAIGEIRTTGRLLRALGLIEPDVDLLGELTRSLGAGVAGFYDPEHDALVVRAKQLTPYARVVLAHELTHALQDQHFELDRPELDARDDEGAFTFAVLAEGDAVRIGEAYRQSLPEAERKKAGAEELGVATGSAALMAGVPPILQELRAFPYVEGPEFVRAILDAGGRARLDRAFAVPPVTSEQIRHPRRFLKGEGRLEVETPDADGDVIDQGVFGAFMLEVLLGSSQPPGQPLGPARAAAVDGWGGDWYVAWEQGDEVCVRVAFLADRPGGFQKLEAMLDKWAGAHPNAGVRTEDERVLLTACG